MRRAIVIFIGTIGVVVAADGARATTLPKSYRQYSPVPEHTGASLSHLVVEINGHRKLVNPGETFGVIRGDKVEIVSAILKDRSSTVQFVNLVGFETDKKRPKDDRGTAFGTDRGFNSSSAVDVEKQTYAIVASSGKSLHGVVYMKIDMPRLKFADIRINQKVKVMREGEVLIVKADDKIKVENVVTNLESSDDVNFEIVKLLNSEIPKQHFRPAAAYEIRFSRKSNVFARIPMLIEGL